MVLLDVVSNVEPAVSYGLKNRLIIAAVLLIPYFTWDWFLEWFDQAFFQAILGERPLPAWLYLDLKSRLIIVPFIAGMIFVVPSPGETVADHVLLRFTLTAILALVVVVLWFVLGIRGADRF